MASHPTPALLVITGLPGTGKTTLARALALRHRLPLLAKDTVKEPLLDVLGASSQAESRQLSDASFAALFALARELLSLGSSVILEGNFRSGEHEQALARVREGLDIALAQALCSASDPVRLERLRARQHDPSRHPGHRDAEQAVSGAQGCFLEIPGERFLVDCSAPHTQAEALDAWVERTLAITGGTRAKA